MTATVSKPVSNGRLLDAKDERLNTLTPLRGYAKKPLAKLTDAVQDIKDEVDDIDSRVWTALQRSKKPSENLSVDESAAICLYTIEWEPDKRSLYSVLNEKLRQEDRRSLLKWFSYLKLLLTALFKLPAIQGTVWRGVAGDLRYKYKCGDELTWWAFSSTTSSISVLQNSQYLGNEKYCTLFAIECFNGRDIKKHSYFENEEEILLLPCSHFKVVDHVGRTDGFCIIHLREIPLPHILLESPLPEHSDNKTTGKSSSGTEIKKLEDEKRRLAIENDYQKSQNVDLQNTNGKLSERCREYEEIVGALQKSMSNLQERCASREEILSNLKRVTVTHRSDRMIASITPKSTWLTTAETVAGGNGEGDALNQLKYPWGLFIGEDLHLWIADCLNHRIVKWLPGDECGKVVAGGRDKGSDLNHLDRPTDVVFDKVSRSLLIVDQFNRRLLRWVYGATSGEETVVKNTPSYGFVFDKDGRLYVPDTEKNVVLRYEPGQQHGTVVAGGNGCGDRLNQLNFPSYVWVDADYNLFVSDRDNHRIVKWTKNSSTGILVAGGRGRGSRLEQMSSPNGIVVDKFETIYVAECGNHRVVRWVKGAEEGEIIAGTGIAGRRSDQLHHPVDLEFDLQGNMYVVDCTNHRVQKFPMVSDSNI